MMIISVIMKGEVAVWCTWPGGMYQRANLRGFSQVKTKKKKGKKLTLDCQVEFLS